GGGGVLGQPDGIVQRRNDQVGAEPHGPRALADGAGQHERRGGVAVLDEVMLGEPDGSEPEPFGPGDLVQRLTVERAERAVPLRGIAEVVPEAERGWLLLAHVLSLASRGRGAQG